MNEAYRTLLNARIQGAVAVAKAYSAFQHKLLKGELREIVIRDLLRPFFPSDVGLGTGEIVSALEGAEHSSQQDVILYNRRILPPLLGDDRTGLFPVESVLATVEIKSQLTVETLKEAHINARSVHRLKLQSGGNAENDAAAALLPRLTCLLAFETDLTKDGKHEIRRYEEIRDGRYSKPPSDKEVNPDNVIPEGDPPALMLICVVGRGLWWWHHERREFLETTITRDFDEVAALVTIIGNCWQTISTLRGEPRIGRYLFPIGEQIFDSIAFERLYPDVVEKMKASTQDMLRQIQASWAAMPKSDPSASGD